MNAVALVAGVIDALNGLGVPYMAVGSFSSNLYGRARSTKDADFVVELGRTSVHEIAARLGADYSVDPQMSFEGATGTMRYRLSHPATGFVIELFLLGDDPHDRERFARRVRADIGGRSAFVATAEDVVITKLRWSRLGKRKKDIDDVAGVLAVSGDKLDLDYVRGWCDRHGNRELFEKLLAEARGIAGE